mgnify:CR=1 FL=1
MSKFGPSDSKLIQPPGWREVFLLVGSLMGFGALAGCGSASAGSGTGAFGTDPTWVS